MNLLLYARNDASHVFLALCLLSMANCGSQPAPVSDPFAAALTAHDNTKAAYEAKDANAAKRSADEVARMLELANERALQDGKTADEAKTIVDPIAALHSQALEWAELAHEEREVCNRVTGLKAKAWRTSRDLAAFAVLELLAAGADQAATHDHASLPDEVKQLARAAAALAAQAGIKAYDEQGNVDYAAVATALRAWRQQPPVVFHQFMAMAFVMAGYDSLALFEMEGLDTSNEDARTQEWVRIERGAIYRIFGYKRLAERQFISGGASGRKFGAEEQAIVHLLLAAFEIQEKNYGRADLELARSIRVDPNNPFAVFLTGERLLASGEKERAAACLEAACQGQGKSAWIAKRVADRAREIRDTKGEVGPVLSSNEFVCELILAYVWDSARNLASAEKTSALADACRNVGKSIREKLKAALFESNE